jgi:hypothetical protein
VPVQVTSTLPCTLPFAPHGPAEAVPPERTSAHVLSPTATSASTRATRAITARAYGHRKTAPCRRAGHPSTPHDGTPARDEIRRGA